MSDQMPVFVDPLAVHREAVNEAARLRALIAMVETELIDSEGDES